MGKMDEKAVSPVIATILIVAITIVLCASLYMLVGAFNFEVGRTPTTDIIDTEQSREGDVTFTFGPSIPPVDFTDCSLHVGIDGSSEVYRFSDVSTSMFTNDGADPTLLAKDGDDGLLASGVILTIHDLGGEGIISNGDHIVLAPLVDGNAISVTLVENGNGDTIASAAHDVVIP